MSDPVKVTAYLDRDVAGPYAPASESFWATPVDAVPDSFTVGNILTYAPCGLGDTVLARVTDPDSDRPQVLGVTARTDRVTIVLAAALPDDGDSDDADNGDDPDGSDDADDGGDGADAAGVSLALSAVTTAADGLGADAERMTAVVSGIRLPSGVGVTAAGVGVDPGQVVQFLAAAVDAAGDDADPLLTGWLTRTQWSWDVVTGPWLPLGAHGLNTDPPPTEPVTDAAMSDEQVARLADAAAGDDVPDWVDPALVLDGAGWAYPRDARMRAALDSGDPRGYDDAVTLMVRVLAAQRGIPLPPLDRALFDWVHAPDA